MTSLVLSCSLRKAFRIYSFSERSHNNLDRVASPDSEATPLKDLQNVSGQGSRRSACAYAQSDQGLHRPQVTKGPVSCVVHQYFAVC